MKVYRIKHLPTGLYYRPSSEVQVKAAGTKRYVKTNLSKKGKLYTQRPSESWFVGKIYNHVATEAHLATLPNTNPYSLSHRDLNRVYDAPIEHWVIEEVA
jgi:hypothetical protein